MKKFVAEKLMELAEIEKDIQSLFMKVKNPCNRIYPPANSNLRKINEHVELLNKQIAEFKERINCQGEVIANLEGSLAERDELIHKLQNEVPSVSTRKTGVSLIADERERQIELK